MNLLDFIIIIITAIFFFSGLFFGFVYRFSKIFALTMSIAISTFTYRPVFDLLTKFDRGYHYIAKALIYFLLMVIGFRISLWIFYFFKKALGFIALFPLMHLMNKLAGAVLGIVLSVVTISFVLFICAKFGYFESLMHAQVENSLFMPYVIIIKNYILPILPNNVAMLLAVFK